MTDFEIEIFFVNTSREPNLSIAGFIEEATMAALVYKLCIYWLGFQLQP